MTQIAIKILQGSAGTQKGLGGLFIYNFLQLSYSACLLITMKIG